MSQIIFIERLSKPNLTSIRNKYVRRSEMNIKTSCENVFNKSEQMCKIPQAFPLCVFVNNFNNFKNTLKQIDKEAPGTSFLRGGCGTTHLFPYSKINTDVSAG